MHTALLAGSGSQRAGIQTDATGMQSQSRKSMPPGPVIGVDGPQVDSGHQPGREQGALTTSVFWPY